jgi:hypothetical protein
MENILTLNGKRYRLVPIEAEWEITLIGLNGCPCGHNGQVLTPKNAGILEVTLGKETFKVGEIIREGKILEFLYNPITHYVLARIEGSKKLVDVDSLKKYVMPVELTEDDKTKLVSLKQIFPEVYDYLKEQETEKPGYPSRKNAELP